MSPFTKNSEMTSLILDSLPMGVLFCDMDYIIRFVNKAYADLLGRRPEELLGCDITEIIPHSRARVVLRDGRAEMGELCQLGPGNALPVVVNRIPVRDGQGRLAGMVSQAIFNDPEELKKLSSKIDHLGHTLNQYKRRIKASLAPQYSLRSILGESAPMRRLKQQVRSYAQLDAPVLILGATGAGKELFAHALHTESPRAEGPLVSINCAAIPKDLFESELFGYARGAFSGAHQDGKIGQIELADKGTLFLDEIGEMPPEIQAKLLRVLESRSVCRVGSVNARNVDFRLVAATNRDLEGMARTGQFRGDLLYRLQGITIVIPPLRERRDEIPGLARQAVTAFCLRNDLPEKALAEPVLDMLMEYPWPGNVRELIHALERACLAAGEGDLILPGHLPTQMRVAVARHRVSRGREQSPEPVPPPARTLPAAHVEDGRAGTAAIVGGSGDLPSLREWKSRAEEEYVRRVMTVSAGDARRAAGVAGISRGHWYELVKKYHP